MRQPGLPTQARPHRSQPKIAASTAARRLTGGNGPAGEAMGATRCPLFEPLYAVRMTELGAKRPKAEWEGFAR
jgi:hypothetical protein